MLENGEFLKAWAFKADSLACAQIGIISIKNCACLNKSFINWTCFYELHETHFFPNFAMCRIHILILFLASSNLFFFSLITLMRNPRLIMIQLPFRRHPVSLLLFRHIFLLKRDRDI
jgi:hypothetical protein